MIRRQAGFTLIELVMVIVILGILAAVAVPRFVDLSDGANEAAANAGLGALRSTAAMLYAENAVNGNAVWPTGTQLAAGVSPAGTCTNGEITLDDISATYATGQTDCATAITNIDAITIVP